LLVERLLVERFAAERFAAERFAAERFAAERFVVERFVDARLAPDCSVALRADDLRVDDLRVDDLRVDDLRVDDLRPALRGGGTLSPSSRASDRPIAIACSRLRTVPPCPCWPRFSVPRLRRCIAFSTLSDAPRLYFRVPDRLAAAIVPSR
jgi:hypothetical protein